MEPAAVNTRPTAVSSLLGVPGSIAWDGDENKDAEVISGIRPKSSPLPRRRSDSDLDDWEFELTRSSSRRVSFADTIGLHLVRVKEFDSWDKSIPVNFDSLEGEKSVEEYYLSSLYTPPPSEEALVLRVQEQKLELESVELLRGTTTIRGVIRVLNISFDKTVYIRTSLDAWATHFDLLAEYILGSSHGNMDAFSFKLTMVPPFGENGSRVDFCLRYETPVGTFWANNRNQNYVMFCHQKIRELKENQPKDTKGRRKSILKISQEFPFDENRSSNNFESSDVHIDVGEMARVNICETHRGAIQKEPQNLIVESSWNSSGRKQRKAAHMAQRRKRSGQQGTSYSLAMCDKPSFGVQDSTSWEESVKPEISTISSALSEWNGEQASLRKNENDANDGPPLLVRNVIEKDWEESLQEEEEEMMQRCAQDGVWEDKIIVEKELEGKDMEEVVTKEAIKDLEEDMKWREKDYGRTEKTDREEEALEGTDAGAEVEEIVVYFQNKLVDNLCMQMDIGITDADGQIKLENVPETSVQGKLTVNEVSSPCHNESINDVTLHYKSPGGEEMDFIQENTESCLQTDEPANEEEGDGEEKNTSTESLSDDELELYMHSLRDAKKQQNKDFSLCLGKCPSISKRGSRLSMPSISETVDEDHLSNKDDPPDTRSTITLPVLVGGQDSTRSNGMCWKETFSWHNLSRGLLYTVLFVVFFLLAYHYDFLTCFGLYLVSVIWLFCQGEKQSLRRNNKII
ncbi:hypothetical protein UPYG_G00262860 [Umbra pygmaea]|uniref:CBM21 domain-containing protein n=1 Tax=Umbra pygmaea TaxID=75934 RepID=A0ABD0WE02_UMBPY